MQDEVEDEIFDEDLGPSKSQIKREMNALQALGEQLVDMSVDRLNSIPLNDRTRMEIEECQRLKKREAIRRQKQLIGKLMRGEDAEAIRQAIEAFDTSSERHARQLHMIERWRERLTGDDQSALTQFVNDYPQSNVQQLRQAIRMARKDLTNEKNTGQMKKLFRLIKQCVEQHQDNLR